MHHAVPTQRRSPPLWPALPLALLLTACAPAAEEQRGAAPGQRTYALAPSPQGTYTSRTWPAAAGGYYNLDALITVEAVDSGATYFWSHQFTVQNVEGGYLGLQNMGQRHDGTVGKLAIFSLWNATGSSGPSCKPFGGEGVGLSCRVPYDWQLGRAYRLRVWALSTDAQGRWWGAWVKDTQTGVETFIGQLRAPAKGGLLGSWSINWTEYFSGISSCSGQPYARGRFGEPRANNGSVKPSSSKNFLSSTAGCQNGLITVQGTDAIHQMGLGGGGADAAVGSDATSPSDAGSDTGGAGADGWTPPWPPLVGDAGATGQSGGGLTCAVGRADAPGGGGDPLLLALGLGALGSLLLRRRRRP